MQRLIIGSLSCIVSFITALKLTKTSALCPLFCDGCNDCWNCYRIHCRAVTMQQRSLLQKQSLHLSWFVAAVSLNAASEFVIGFLWMAVLSGCCNWMCCSSTLLNSCASTTPTKSFSSCSITRCSSWSRMSTVARASTGSSLTLASISSQQLISSRRSVESLKTPLISYTFLF